MPWAYSAFAAAAAAGPLAAGEGVFFLPANLPLGPVLGAILTTSASSATVSQGVTLLAVYSLGLGLPFLAVAASTERLVRGLRGLSRFGRSLQIGAGAVMVVMGVAMITGQLNVFSYWLLGTFPVLAQIG